MTVRGAPRERSDNPRTARVDPAGRALGRLPGGTGLQVDGGHGRLPEGASVGIRPEKIVVTRADVAGQLPTTNAVRGTVTTATYLGASTEYDVQTPWGGILKAFAQNLADSSRARPGEEVVLTWDAAHAFVLAPSPERTPLSVEKAEEAAGAGDAGHASEAAS